MAQKMQTAGVGRGARKILNGRYIQSEGNDQDGMLSTSGNSVRDGLLSTGRVHQTTGGSKSHGEK
jgi:hypothetical protein